jgi:serine/threonine protein kinase
MMETFGQYILLEKVAAGGMAELFKAKKIGIEGFERVLAIKRILPHLSSDEEFINMFIAEAKLVARLSHKNIAQVYDFGKIGQNYFIAMEYIRGKDLRGILKRCNEKNIKLPVALTVFIAKEVSSALSYAHRQKDSMGRNLNIIHRDVSPQNILISYEGEVKVVDFGIAKAGTHSKTITGVLKGKLSYMSPEQAWGKPIDHRSDIFSLGIVLYEMLTGERLFKGSTEINTLEKVREAKVEIFPSSINANLPPELDVKVLKALAKEVTNRYQDASAMEADLGDTLFKLSSPDPAPLLKQFMHDLFQADIETEHKSEMQEETMSIQFARKAKAEEMKSRKAETIKRTPGLQSPSQKKRKVFPYVISVSLVVSIIVAALMFWINRSENTLFPVPVPPVVNTVETKKPEMQINKQTDKQQSEVRKTDIEEGRGGVTINAFPWADVYLNGKAYGTTPQTVRDLKAGTYKVRLQNPDFPVWEIRVRVSERKIARVSHEFEAFGKVIINATPWADVYLDGTLKGQTPLTINKVAAGKHQIRVSREGFLEYSKTFEIREGATERFSATLKKEGG